MLKICWFFIELCASDFFHVFRSNRVGSSCVPLLHLRTSCFAKNKHKIEQKKKTWNSLRIQARMVEGKNKAKRLQSTFWKIATLCESMCQNVDTCFRDAFDGFTIFNIARRIFTERTRTRKQRYFPSSTVKYFSCNFFRSHVVKLFSSRTRSITQFYNISENQHRNVLSMFTQLFFI